MKSSQICDQFATIRRYSGVILEGQQMFTEDTNPNWIDSTGGAKFESVTRLRQSETAFESVRGLKRVLPASVLSRTDQSKKLLGQFCDWRASTNAKVRSDLRNLELFCKFLNSWS